MVVEIVHITVVANVRLGMPVIIANIVTKNLFRFIMFVMIVEEHGNLLM